MDIKEVETVLEAIYCLFPKEVANRYALIYIDGILNNSRYENIIFR